MAPPSRRSRCPLCHSAGGGAEWLGAFPPPSVPLGWRGGFAGGAGGAGPARRPGGFMLPTGSGDSVPEPPHGEQPACR